jgi:hypothetical protein
MFEMGCIILRLNAGRIDYTTTTYSYSNTTDFLANIPNQVQINFPDVPHPTCAAAPGETCPGWTPPAGTCLL